ncbi:hypothetical protein Taro_026693 [Colocasia esculenta]|uniref:Uncharacterized protein n=1 Tax=Colocasia esculenta TaxID=4460 RepID=A0A843VS16_COLES|nr:hypothetical protein [Colocasia esculenta]
MACRTVLRSVFLSEQWRPASSGAGLSCSSSSAAAAAAATPSSSSFLRSLPRLSLRSRSPWGLLGAPLRCSHGEGGPDSSSLYSPGDLDPPQEAVLKAISEVSKSEGRVSQTTNVVMGGTVTDDSTNEWLALDQKVNSYPTVRGFTAIGTGGDDFVHSMVVAVESVLEQPIPEEIGWEVSIPPETDPTGTRPTGDISHRGAPVGVPPRVPDPRVGPGGAPIAAQHRWEAHRVRAAPVGLPPGVRHRWEAHRVRWAPVGSPPGALGPGGTPIGCAAPVGGPPGTRGLGGTPTGCAQPRWGSHRARAPAALRWGSHQGFGKVKASAWSQKGN